ncbi:MAG: Two-component sensor histidine kinase [Parachlamydiales bacterium]|nr:Two-component sensor histidine kinase [Parachlamydiales bacterium]
MHSQNTDEGVRHLSTAFQLFSEETIRLKEASDKLQQRLQTVNQELAQAHRSLVQKVAELGNVTHYLNNILQNISQGIVFINLDGIITTFNDTAARLFNARNTDVLYKSVWTCFSDDIFGFSLREALRFGLAQRLLYKTMQIDADIKELEISTTYISEGPKAYHGLIIMLRDISEMQRLQRTANRNDRMKELGEMAATVAHEIRNPLGGIRGYATLLSRDLADQKNLQEMAEFIIEGTKSLETLVSTILSYARPIQIQPQSLEIGAFLKQIGQFVRVDPAYPRGVKLDIHIPQDPILAPFDPQAFKSCLLNLIYNAFQAMPQGGLLTIALLQLDNTCQIAVSDTGVGIEASHLNQLFSPFFTTKQKGTGLGLVEAQKIVQAHGGQLDVRSQIGRGSTFTIILPLKKGVK